MARLVQGILIVTQRTAPHNQGIRMGHNKRESCEQQTEAKVHKVSPKLDSRRLGKCRLAWRVTVPAVTFGWWGQSLVFHTLTGSICPALWRRSRLLVLLVVKRGRAMMQVGGMFSFFLHLVLNESSSLTTSSLSTVADHVRPVTTTSCHLGIFCTAVRRQRTLIISHLLNMTVRSLHSDSMMPPDAIRLL